MDRRTLALSFTPLPPREVRLLAGGEVVGGLYRTGAQLGRGGQGEVYECVDLALGRTVAMKVSSTARELLRREGQVLAALASPVIPAVHALGSEPGFDYLVMERIYGRSLQDHAQKRMLSGQPFAIAEVLELLTAIATGLSMVHEAGVAHRDIKPANIMLAPRARVVLMDFGITLPEVNVAASPEVFGTPAYLAPESIRGGLAAGEAWRVDIYALGVVAYELLAGELPFEAANLAQLLGAHLYAAPPPLAQRRDDVPPQLGALIEAMLAKDPLDRPHAEEVAWTAKAMRERLERA